MANQKNALEQLKDIISSGVKTVFGLTPAGQAYNATQKAVQTFQSPQFQQQVLQPTVANVRAMGQNIQAAPQTFKSNFNQMVTPKLNSALTKIQNLPDQMKYGTVNIPQPGEFLTKLENRQDIPSQIFVKPLAGGAKTLGAALIQAPTLALSGGKINPQFWSDAELQKFSSGDTFGERALKSGKEYLRTVPEAAFELYSMGGGAALTGGIKAGLKQAGSGLLNMGLGTLIGDGGQILDNLKNGKPITENLKEATVGGATSAYYIPVFNAVTNTLFSNAIPKVLNAATANMETGVVKNAAQWVAKNLVHLSEENVAQYSQKAWDIVRDTSLSGKLRMTVLRKVLTTEISRGILESPVMGTGFGLLEYVKGEAPLRQALANQITSALIMNPIFRVATGVVGAGAKQVWFGPTGELNPEAGRGLQRSIAMGARRFIGELGMHLQKPQNQAGFIDFQAKIGRGQEVLDQAEQARQNLIQEGMQAEDKGDMISANRIRQQVLKLEKNMEFMRKSINRHAAQVATEKPMQPEVAPVTESPVAPQKTEFQGTNEEMTKSQLKKAGFGVEAVGFENSAGIINVNGKPALATSWMDDGSLSGISVQKDFRRTGVATQFIDDILQQDGKLVVTDPNEKMMALLKKSFNVTDINGEGQVVVTPRTPIQSVAQPVVEASTFRSADEYVPAQYEVTPEGKVVKTPGTGEPIPIESVSPQEIKRVINTIQNIQGEALNAQRVLFQKTPKKYLNNPNSPEAKEYAFKFNEAKRIVDQEEYHITQVVEKYGIKSVQDLVDRGPTFLSDAYKNAEALAKARNVAPEVIKDAGAGIADIQSHQAKVDNYQRLITQYEKAPTPELETRIRGLEQDLGYAQSFVDMNKPQTDLLGNTVAEKTTSVKPQQESMIPEIGVGKTTPEETLRTMEKMLAEKRAEGAGVEGTPMGQEINNATQKEQMGGGLFAQEQKTPEAIVKDTFNAIQQHISDLEDTMRSTLGDKSVEKLRVAADKKNLSETEYMNSLRETLAKKKIEIPALPKQVEAINTPTVEEVLAKPKAQWGDEEVKVVADSTGMSEENIKKATDAQVKKVLKLSEKATPETISPTDQTAILDIEDAMRDAIYRSDDAQLALLTEARNQLVDGAKNSGMEVKVTPIDDLRAEVGNLQTSEISQAKKAVVESGMGSNPEVSQYAKIISDAVHTWNLNRNKDGFGDVDAMTKRFPGLDEALDAIRTVSGDPGMDIGMEDLAMLKFPKGSVRQVRRTPSLKKQANINITDPLPVVEQKLAEFKTTNDGENQGIARQNGEFIVPLDKETPLLHGSTVPPVDGTPPGTTIPPEIPETPKKKLPGPKVKTEKAPPPKTPDQVARDVMDNLKQQDIDERAIKTGMAKKAKGVSAVFRNVMEGFVNKYYVLGDIGKMYKAKTGKELPIESDPLKMAEIFSGASQKATEFVHEEYVKKILTPANKEGVAVDLSHYLKLRRFIQNVDFTVLRAQGLLNSGDIALMKQGQEMMRKAVTGEINPGGITKQAAETTIAAMMKEWGPERFNKITGYADQVYQFNGHILDLAGQIYKIIPPDVYQQLKERVNGYVPEFVMKYWEGQPTGNAGTTVRSFDQEYQKYLQKFRGTTSFIEDPLVTTMKKALYLFNYGEQQKVFQSLVDGGTKVGLVKEVKAGARPIGTFTQKAEMDMVTMGKLEKIMKDLNISFETKKSLGRGVLGKHVYTPETDTSQVYRKFASSPLTTVHEIGHSIDNRYGLSDLFINKPTATARAIRAILASMEPGNQPDWTRPGQKEIPLPKTTQEQYAKALELYKTVQQELRALADSRLVQQQYGRKASEKMANLFASSIMNPEETQRIAPNAYKIFLKFMNLHEELQPLLKLKAPSLVQGEEQMTSTIFARSRPKVAPQITGEGENLNIPDPGTGKSIITVNMDGKFKYYEVPDEMYRAMSYLTKANTQLSEGFGQWLATLGKNTLRKGATTWSLSFSGPNFIRDQRRFLAFSKYGWDISHPETIINYPFALAQGFWSAATGTVGKPNPLYEMFVNSKAANSTFQKVFTPEGFAKALEGESVGDIVKRRAAGINAIEKWNNIWEETTKLTAFYRGLQEEAPQAFSHQGLVKWGLKPEANIPQEALDKIAYEVRNYGGSPDFSKMGVNGRQMNLLFMFFNARLQGVASDAKRFVEDPVRVGMNNLVMATIPAAALYYWNRYATTDPQTGKSAMDETPDYVKDNYFLAFTGRYNFNKDTGKKEYEYISVPKNDWDKIFGTSTEMLLDYAYKKDPATFWNAGMNAFGAMSPLTFNAPSKPGIGPLAASFGSGVMSSLNPVLGAPLEMLTNYDFFKQMPIISDKLQQKMPAAQFYSYTTDLAKYFGNLLGISPVMIEHVAQRMGGSTASDAFRAVSWAAFGQKIDARYAPILKRFYGWTGGQTDQDLSQAMFDKITRLKQTYNVWKGYMDSGDLKNAEFIRNQTPQVLQYTKLQGYANQISEMRNNIPKVRDNPNYTDAQKAAYIQALNLNMVKMMEQMNNLILEPGNTKLSPLPIRGADKAQAAESTPTGRSLVPPTEAASVTIGGTAKYKPFVPSTGVMSPSTGTTDLTPPEITMKTPTLQDYNEQSETDKAAIHTPDLVIPEKQNEFDMQFASVNETIASMESRIKALYTADKPLNIREKYIQQYTDQIAEAKRLRWDFAQQNPQFWQSYLKSSEGVSWLKKEATAWYKNQGLDIPSWVSGLGKTAGTGKAKVKTFTPSKVSMGRFAIKKVAMPKIKLKASSASTSRPQLKISSPSSRAMPKLPTLKTIKIKRPRISSTSKALNY